MSQEREPHEGSLRGGVRGAHKGLVAGRRVRTLIENLAAVIPQGARVLDVGAGSGEISAGILERRPDLELEGIDVLVRPGTKIPVTEYDGQHMPHDDGSFDYCLFVDVLHHTDDANVVLAEAMRVARRGVVIKDHLSENAWARLRLRVMDWFGNYGHGVRLPYNYWSKAQWDAAFSKLAVEQRSYRTQIPLYPFPFSLLFGRGLHFISVHERPEA